ncbi:homoserine kinase [Acidipila rosea]|uniref:Homoserine kinase n=1 Tax=Acidipila rosea TaxID=768535 RepID=A0A4R1L048_9BACT|nr:homoserine kinase [Acidipila rosea]TCK70250.1 homoserine kinase [Acidipila rosea]
MRGCRLRLPATSANLGPGFDALALALSFYLEIEAEESDEFVIDVSGRNRELCSAVKNNLLLDTYTEILQTNNAPVVPVKVRMVNGIPLGMGCGSSAATRLAGVALASHFGGLKWERERILTAASLLEGHPDNTAACWHGGLSVACWHGKEVEAISITPGARWKAIIAMPARPLPTRESRAVLPESYSRADAVANLQHVALLTAAFAQGRGDLLHSATQDWMHQPYRERVCPLLPLLAPLAGRDGLLSVTLSGAGPSILLLVDADADMLSVRQLIDSAAGESEPVELIECTIESAPAVYESL